ncbi:MAG TPA: glycosyltransferase family A protein [Bacillota bacterium]|nr:glycosyltransferase family A protein [Bacillota bacterium]
MSPPLVSVLIPVYNGEPYLAECLESILAQDFGDFEVLLSDDGSKDNSRALLERFAQRDPRIRWWRNPQNLGIGGNFNACLQAAQGELIKYVLQDDKFLEPSALRRMVAALQADPSVSLVVSASHLIDAQSRSIMVRNHFGTSGARDGKQVIVECLQANANIIGEPSLGLFRKGQATRGFDESLRQLIDLEMWFYLLEQGRLSYLAEPLCAFRQHPAQLTETNRRSGLSAEEDLALLEKYYSKPWMKEALTPQAIFTQIYYLRKRSSPRAAALGKKLANTLDRPTYTRCWVRHRLSRPLYNLKRSLQKRGLYPGFEH